MKRYAQLEELPENVNKKCVGKVDLKNEIKVEEHDVLNGLIYYDDVSQSVFLLFQIINLRIIIIIMIKTFIKCHKNLKLLSSAVQ